MTYTQILQSVIELIIFLAASYLIFYKKFIEELGKQTAELTFIKQKTFDVEEVKKTFNQELEVFKKQIQLDIAKEVEPLRATLNRENIAYQIYNTEYIKLRFQRLDALYGKLYELKKFCQDNLFFYTDDNDFREKKVKFHEHYRQAEDALYLSAIYIDEGIMVSVIDLLNESFKAIEAFTMYYNTDVNRRQSLYQRQDLIQLMLDKNNNSLERLNNCINKLPSLLRNIEIEFKQNLTLSV